ncbi:MAG: pyrroline-5-carboxylate reductase [Alphaproteobacteria bacterium]|nr:pyrroline-5-carboxylate reductase [Alphaproteobacteria bacterium]MCB9975947.1 pyrroline-5-carboxylate reductase [Rhodospirillales bacterium]
MTVTDDSPIDTLLLCGCGKMGSALLERWLEEELAENFVVVDPAPLPAQFSDNPRVKGYTALPSTFHKDPDVVVIAVKPQILNGVLQTFKACGFSRSLYLSIAAGKPIRIFEDILGSQAPIVRSMPNTPASIGRGVIAAVANGAAQDRHKATAGKLLRCSGMLVWLENEVLMDAVTALSGSGPAYVFLLIESLAKAGEKLGLPPDTSMKLARQTVIGSAALAETLADVPASQLRQNVTSPGGTTEAALDVLMSDAALQKLLDAALRAARDRGKALSQ